MFTSTDEFIQEKITVVYYHSITKSYLYCGVVNQFNQIQLKMFPKVSTAAFLVANN